jgi:hypothetical protein
LLGFETDGRRTVLRERESTPSHREALRTAIANALAAAGSPTDPTTPLEELVEIAVSHFRV